MYIGNTDVSGLHHLFVEVVNNSIDEAMAGYCDEIHVKIHADGSLSVEDNGSGIPVEIHSKTNVSTLETVLTILHAGGASSARKARITKSQAGCTGGWVWQWLMPSPNGSRHMSGTTAAITPRNTGGGA